jgi:hypothetical protein
MRKRANDASAARGKSKPESGNGDVGYCRPPKAHQFKPGRSGNPKGRPKGAKNEATIIRSILDKKISVREAGKSRKISVMEAMLLKYAEDALRGNTKSAAFLLNRYQIAQGSAPETDQLDEDDQEVLNDFIQRIQADLRPEKDRS